jgi:hypothetical protein
MEARPRSGLAPWRRSTPGCGRTVPGKAYINYCDSELQDWPTAYWGPNLARLKGVKRSVDPTNIFRFSQSIPLP